MYDTIIRAPRKGADSMLCIMITMGTSRDESRLERKIKIALEFCTQGVL